MISKVVRVEIIYNCERAKCERSVGDGVDGVDATCAHNMDSRSA